MVIRRLISRGVIYHTHTHFLPLEARRPAARSGKANIIRYQWYFRLCSLGRPYDPCPSTQSLLRWLPPHPHPHPTTTPYPTLLYSHLPAATTTTTTTTGQQRQPIYSYSLSHSSCFSLPSPPFISLHFETNTLPHSFHHCLATLFQSIHSTLLACARIDWRPEFTKNRSV